MTAEIAILNKSAVALAADSAVTVGSRGTGPQKVFESANKLFALSKYHPVGLMIYGQAGFMEVDWETIVKIYRDERGDQPFDTLHDNADDFLLFLQGNRALFNQSCQDNYVKTVIRDELSLLRDRIINEIRKKIENDGTITDPGIRQQVKSVISNRHSFLRNRSSIKAVDGTLLSPLIAEGIKDTCKPYVVRMRKAIFGILPLDSADSRKLNEIVLFVFTKQGASPHGTSGVVIAGYGTQEFFPALEEFQVDGIFSDTLKFVRLRTVGNASISTIIPFAQSDMVWSFMEGVDPLYQDFVERIMYKAFDTYGSTLLDLIDELSDPRKTQYLQAMSRANKDLGGSVIEAMKEFRKQQFSDPVVQTVATLPKSELAEMAESLVNLTSFRQHVTPNTETVGGPIDVAVISRGDGFIWIKRKHYFDPDLNHHFFRNYFREVPKT